MSAPTIQVQATLELLEALDAAMRAARHDIPSSQHIELDCLRLSIVVARYKAGQPISTAKVVTLRNPPIAVVP